MLKVRSLPTNWGDSPDGRYYNFVAEQNGTSPYLHDEAWCRAKYDSVLGSNFRGSLGYSGTEQISYTGRGHTRFNNCDHVRSEEVNKTFFFAWMTNAYYRRLMWYQRYRYPLSSVTLYDISHLTTDVMLARNRAWWNMQPRFEGEVQLLNSLFELKDFKVCAKHLFDPDHSSFLKLLRKRRLPRVYEPTRPAAEAILLWNLALKPLVKDIFEIIAQAQIIVSEAQREFEGRGLELQSSHYSEELARSDTLAVPGGTYWYWTTGKTHRTKFTATMEYKYRYKPRAAALAFQQFWGLKPSFETLWNAMPWSFVADYFAAIGKAVHAMHVDPNVAMTYRQYCESLKTTLNSGAFIVPNAAIGGLIVGGQWIDIPTDYIHVAGISSKIYHRYNTSPSVGPALPKFRQPSGTQLTNLLALARCLF